MGLISEKKIYKIAYRLVVVTLLGSLIYTYVKNKADNSANINTDTACSKN